MDAALAMVLPCYSGDVAANLKKSGNEAPIARGVTLMGERFEIFANPQTGTFTLVLQTPNKSTCILGAGTDFEAVKDKGDEF